MTEKETFEVSFKRLEKIVEELEDGRLSLDESLKKYEEGMRLAKECSKMLQAAQRKIEVLMKKEGKLVTEDLNDTYEEESIE